MARTQTAPAESKAAAGRNRITAFRERARRTRGGFLAWRIAVTVLGVAVIAGGIVLLPLPGPGWVIIFAGLGLLATEYDRASRLLKYARRQVARWTDWVKRQPRWIQVLTGLLGVAFLAGVLYVVYRLLYA